MKKDNTSKRKYRKLRSRLLRRYFFDKMILSIYRYCRNKIISLRRRLKESSIGLWSIITVAIVAAGIIYLLGTVQYTNDTNNAINAVTEIVCAIISGAITIFGIAWTLHSQQKTQKEEDRLAIRPYITYGSEKQDVIIPVIISLGDNFSEYETPFLKSRINTITPEQLGKNRWICEYGSFCLHVADYAECCLDSIMINDERYFLDAPLLMRKGSTYQLDFSKYYFKMERRNNLHDVDICVADMRSNLYYYSLETDRGTDCYPDTEVYNEKGKRIGLSVFKITGIASRTDNYDRVVLKKENAQCGTPLTGYWSNLKRFLFHRKELADQLVANYKIFHKKHK